MAWWTLQTPTICSVSPRTWEFTWWTCYHHRSCNFTCQPCNPIVPSHNACNPFDVEGGPHVDSRDPFFHRPLFCRPFFCLTAVVAQRPQFAKTREFGTNKVSKVQTEVDTTVKREWCQMCEASVFVVCDKSHDSAPMKPRATTTKRNFQEKLPIVTKNLVDIDHG